MSVKDVTDMEVCRAVAEFRARGLELPWPYEVLAERTGQPIKVCYRAMERADDHGLLEYGVSLRTAWLTEKGQALLDADDVERCGCGQSLPPLAEWSMPSCPKCVDAADRESDNGNAAPR